MHPDIIIRYYASGVVLYIDSDTSYLSVRNDRRHVGRHYYSRSPSNDTTKPQTPTPPSNRLLDATSHMIQNAITSAVESELGG